MNLLRIEQWADGRRASLLVPFEVVVKSGLVITVPAGFVTDFASIPRPFWNILPPSGSYARAAVVHDYLYCTGITSKADADAIFLELMEELGVNWFARHIMYWAVKLFGWPVWRRYRRKGPN